MNSYKISVHNLNSKLHSLFETPPFIQKIIFLQGTRNLKGQIVKYMKPIRHKTSLFSVLLNHPYYFLISALYIKEKTGFKHTALQSKHILLKLIKLISGASKVTIKQLTVENLHFLKKTYILTSFRSSHQKWERWLIAMAKSGERPYRDVIESIWLHFA